MPEKIALIAGATGLIGNICLKNIIDDPFYVKVIVVSRKAINFSHPKMTEHIVDFDHLENYKQHIKADHIYCCLGTTMKKAGTKENFRKVDLEYPFSLAKIAFENNATQFNLVSALGADINSRVFYNRVKGETEKLISSLDYPSLNIFRPSILLGDRKENRPGEKTGIILMQSLKFLFIGKLKKYKPVSAAKVAEAMIKFAKKEKKGINIIESDKIQEMV